MIRNKIIPAVGGEFQANKLFGEIKCQQLKT